MVTKRKILICDNLDVPALGLSDDDFLVDFDPKITREGLLARVGEYDAVVVRSRTKVDAEVIARASRLKLIARPGTGLDNIDQRAANARGIEIVNSPEALVNAVAEHVIGLMLSLSRSIPGADASVRSGKWEKDRFVGVELRGKTLGIAGMGRIGRRVGEIAKVIGMSLLGYDVIEIPQAVLAPLGCRMVDMDSLFSMSDYITLHVPLTEETRHMVDSRRLSLMKKGAYIVNASRGEVMDETALVEALRSGVLAGAALDVFEREPPSELLVSAPNIIATPHIGGQTRDAQSTALAVVGSKIRQFFHVDGS